MATTTRGGEASLKRIGPARQHVTSWLTLAALCLLTAGCADQGVVTLQGAGATFPEPLYKRWFREFYNINPKLRISYQGTGSGAGVKQFLSGLTDFGASDAAMTADEIAKVPEEFGGVKLLPMTAGCVTLAYNLPGIETPIRLSRSVYARMMLDEEAWPTDRVERWNDPAIVAANPGVELPDLPITVVQRSDSSGTTYIFTQHLVEVLRQIQPDLKLKPGKSVDWLAGIAAKGNPGVAFTIDQTPGAIGYLEYGYTRFSGTPTAILENRAGEFVPAGTDSAAIALAEATFDANLIAWVSDPSQAGAYPIVGYTWMLARGRYDDPEVGSAIKKILRYGVDEGQTYAADLGYVPLPSATAERVRQAIDSIEVVGATAEISDHPDSSRPPSSSSEPVPSGNGSDDTASPSLIVGSLEDPNPGADSVWCRPWPRPDPRPSF
mgnify:CR=1 FL=1